MAHKKNFMKTLRWDKTQRTTTLNADTLLSFAAVNLLSYSHKNALLYA